MKTYDRTLNPELLSFWKAHARPALIGLVHIDFPPTKLINWAQRRVTPTGAPSAWTHCFLFLEQKQDEWLIAESDIGMPLPGFEQEKPDGPQISPVSKWSTNSIDEAMIVDPQFSPAQIELACAHAHALCRAGLHYPRVALADTFVAITIGDLRFRGPLASDDTMHCSHFVHDCLRAAGCNPFDPDVLSKNVTPEHIAQIFPAIAHYSMTRIA